MTRRIPITVVALALLAALVSTVPAQAEPASRSEVWDDLESRLLTTRPTLGPTWLVDLSGTGTAERLTARTLQGIVNRSQARLYLLDPGDGGARNLFDAYVGAGMVDHVGTTNLAGALDRFAAEASGFVVADPAEPWSVADAAAIAARQGALVTTAGQVAGLEGRGLAQLADTRGRYGTASIGYPAIAAEHREHLASPTVAIISPTDTLWDFVVQQELLAVYSRPTSPSWSAVEPIITDTPPGQPVYGYIATTDVEEVLGVATLSANGLRLVPTDTTRNLSFHIAVAASAERVPMADPRRDDVDPCSTEDVNVVVALSDGDNLNVPLNHFRRAENWMSPRRGDLPLGWSITPALGVLAPGAWDLYASEATPNDELVAMIGYGYAAPALLPDPDAFYRRSFAAMEAVGMRTFWSLGGALEVAESNYWNTLDSAAGPGTPDVVLVGYGNGIGDTFYSPAGRQAFTSRSVYRETPAELEQLIRDLLDADPADRPLVTFLSATNWSNPAHELIGRLAPLADEGVRYLTPSEAGACLPPAPPSPPPPDPTPRECWPLEPITETGFELISRQIVNEIRRTPTVFDVATVVDAPSEVEPGGRIDYEATLTIDVAGFTHATFAERVEPVIASGFGGEVADGASMRVAIDGFSVRFPRAAHTTTSGDDPEVDAPVGVRVTHDDEGFDLHLDAVLEGDTRVEPEPFEVVVRWSVVAEERTAPFDVDVTHHPLAFTMAIAITVDFDGFIIDGSAAAEWTCEQGSQVLATTRVGGTAPDPSLPPDEVPVTTLAPNGILAPSTNHTTPVVASVPVEMSDIRPVRAHAAPAAVAVSARPRYAG